MQYRPENVPLIGNDKEIDPQQLARLLAVRPAPEAWTDADLHAMLTHQLRAELEFDLQQIIGIGHATVTNLRMTTQPPITTFGELILHPRPPLPLLELLKSFGKNVAHQMDTDLPADIGRVLYYAAIAAALRTCGTRISSLSNPMLQEGFGWACDLRWMTADLADLFAACSRLLDTPT